MLYNRTNPADDLTLNQLGVAVADKLDKLMGQRPPVPRETRDAVINLRNTADALLLTAEEIAKAPTLLDPRVLEQFRLAVGMMLQTCSELPAPMMPHGDRLRLVPAETQKKPKRLNR